MLALPATSNASPSLQGTLNRSRADATRRAADQLESQAQTLRAQADQQESEADTPARATPPVVQKIADDQITYTAQLKSSKAAEVAPKTQDFLLRLYQATSQKFADNGNALKTDADAAPVRNPQGQTTGRIVNLVA